MIRYLKGEGRSLSTETLYNYLRYCIDSCLLHLVPREDLLGKRLLGFQEKIYLTDHGIRQGSLEVDFSALRGGEKLYVQVAYLLADDRTMEREFASMESIPDNYPKLVLSMDEIDRSRNGIIHKNIRDFLLE